MEKETRTFLILIANTIAAILLWMIANVLVGIYFGLAFFYGSPGWKNILYYALSLITFILLIIYLRRKWKV